MLSKEGSMKAFFSTMTFLFREQICMQNSSPGSRSEIKHDAHSTASIFRLEKSCARGHIRFNDGIRLEKSYVGGHTSLYNSLKASEVLCRRSHKLRLEKSYAGVGLAMVTFKELVTSNQKYLLIAYQDDDTAKNRTHLLVHAAIRGNYARNWPSHNYPHLDEWSSKASQNESTKVHSLKSLIHTRDLRTSFFRLLVNELSLKMHIGAPP
ncbi:hypothetical protein ACH5RR_038765 [Cinchona calisaya]|uniref:Uncharacterized protein n=1 Tax=Cinchona calisaya TaxID=153742 RepID=A0ABD2XZK7_9GENT